MSLRQLILDIHYEVYVNSTIPILSPHNEKTLVPSSPGLQTIHKKNEQRQPNPWLIAVNMTLKLFTSLRY